MRRSTGLLALFLSGCGGGGAGDPDLDAAAEPRCGDGVLDGGEECDLGDSNDDHGACSSTCRLQACGDGSVGQAETCDDGNVVDGDGCNSDCTPSGQEQWSWTYDGLSEVEGFASDAVVDRQGRTAVVGWWSASPLLSGGAGIWVRLIDVDGETLWRHAEAGQWLGSDYGAGIAIDADGDFIVVGSTWGGHEHLEDIWVRKLDPAGHEVWTTTFDGDGHGYDWGQDVAVDGDGDIVVTAVVETRAGDDDIWVAKLDPEGRPLWQRTIDVGSRDRGAGVAVDSAGNLLVTGEVGSGPGGLDLWLAKLDPDGDELWTRQRPGDVPLATERGSGVAVDAEGNVFVCGSVPDPDPDRFRADAFLAKYDPDGGELWAHTFHRWDGIGSDAAEAVVVDEAGDLFVAGSVETGSGFGDAWVAKVGGDGEELWQFVLDGGTGRADYAFGLALGAHQEVVAVGAVTAELHQHDAWMRTFVSWGAVGNGQTFHDLVRAPDRASAVTIDANGDVLAAGATATGPVTKYDEWLTRLDGRGFPVWERQWDSGTLGDDEAAGIAAGADGSLFVASSVGGSAENGGRDVRVARLDASGREEWSVIEEGSFGSWDLAMAVAANDGGGPVVAGVLDAYWDEARAWIASYDASGSPLWSWSIEGEPSDSPWLGTHASAVAVGAGGDVTACGGVTTGDERADAWVRRFDREGAELWSAVPSGLGPEADCAAIAVNASGTAFAAGWSGEYGKPEERSIWIASLSANGEEAWVSPDVHLGEARGLALTPQNGLFVAGWIREDPQADGDAWLVRLDPQGHELWARVHDGPAGGDDAALAVAADPEGGAVVVGEETTEPASGPNIWIQRYGP